MPREITVREAVPSDVTAIQRVAHDAWHAAYDEVIGPAAVDEEVEERYRHAVVADAVERDEVVYRVASDEDVVGFASAGPSNQADDHRTAELYNMYVDPDHWDDGIGNRLFDDVIEHLRADDFENLRMCVLTQNEVGKSFYESHGFPTVEQDTTMIAGERVDEVVYSGTL